MKLTEEQREKLIVALIDCRIANILDRSAEVDWMADVMNFGWIGYDKHSDDELFEDAKNLGWKNIGLKKKDFK